MNRIIKATKEGKLYIETKDFFKQKRIQRTIKKLLNSSIVIEIEKRKESESIYKK